MYIDFSELSRAEVYGAMVQTIIPRPVAWVLSDNGDGGCNLAPFSYFNAVSSDPPLIMLSIGNKPDGAEKDTRRNIRERSHFVVHIAGRTLAPAMTETSRTLAHGDSELKRSGLGVVPFDGFALPRLVDCPIAMACECYRIIDIGPAPQALILGEVKRLWVDDRVASCDADGRLRVDAAAVDPIARLGGSDYVTFGEVLTIPRPS